MVSPSYVTKVHRILLSPTVSGPRDWKETLRLVCERLHLWSQGSLSDLWDEVLKEADKVGVPSSSSMLRSTYVALGEQLRMVSIIRPSRPSPLGVQPLTMMKPTSLSLTAILSQPPYTSLLSNPSLCYLLHLHVLAAIDSFPKGSSPGPSGLRPSHIHEAAHCPSSTRSQEFIEALTSVCLFAAKGNTPPDVIPYFCRATLIASLKKNGGVRPIAVGEVLHRLTPSLKMSHVSYPSSGYGILIPPSTWCCIPGGSESIIHVVNLHLSSNIPSSDKPTLLIDFANALNSIDRSLMFSSIRQRLPSLSAWFESCYGSAPIFYYKDRSLASCSGVQQGDPLSPLGFALTLQPLIELLSSSVPSLRLNLWYLDDSIISGDLNSLHQAMNLIESSGPSRGLHLNRSKCLLSLPQDLALPTNPLPPEIPTSTSGFTLLAPLLVLPHLSTLHFLILFQNSSKHSLSFSLLVMHRWRLLFFALVSHCRNSLSTTVPVTQSLSSLSTNHLILSFSPLSPGLLECIWVNGPGLRPRSRSPWVVWV